MAWLCKGQSSYIPQTNKLIYQQFKKTDPKTHQIYTELVKEHELNNFHKYAGFRRIKMESIDTTKLTKSLKDKKEHFIDPQFPHTNQMLSSEAFQGQIEWIRVWDVVDNAVYAKQQTIKTLQKIKLNRKQFERALIMIARSSPTLFKEILTRQFTPQGVYEFKLFRDGYIRNVVIDDYIPTHNGQPIFVGPARENEVYPMLLEKAIAKVCGSYEAIPEDAQQIMQIIFCGPVNVSFIYQLRQRNKLSQTLHNCCCRNDLIVLVSRKESKIRNYGLNEGEVYHMVGHHEIKMKDQIQNIYQLVSENKLSAWNGKWCLGDAAWNNVDPKIKMELYQTMNKNHSFCVSELDIGRHFQDLLVFESVDTNNKNWIPNQSQNGFPSFVNFQLEEEEPIFVRVTTRSQIRHTLILARQIGQKKYQYIDSFFKEKTYTSELSLKLQKGKYVLVSYHQWFLTKMDRYFVFLSSQNHINLNKGGTFDKDFLAKILLNYNEKQAQHQKQSKKSYQVRLVLQKLGLAYLTLKPEYSKSRTIKIQIYHDRLEKDGWQVLQPYSNIPLVNISDKQDVEATVIVLSKKDIDFSKQNHFPVAAFKLKE